MCFYGFSTSCLCCLSCLAEIASNIDSELVAFTYMFSFCAFAFTLLKTDTSLFFFFSKNLYVLFFF